MKDYTFRELNDKEFEVLFTDLLSESIGRPIDRFSQGRDQGVDGSYFTESNGETIIQCKHYVGSGYKQMISKIKKKEGKKKLNEFDKVKKLNPESYIFATSLSLTMLNKQEIKTLFHPYIKRTSDIYSKENINDLIKKHPKVEENHYKLWISSTNILKNIIDSHLKSRSKFLLQEIIDKKSLFVETSIFYEAIKKLNNKHALIVTGEPGIGKTTLALNLCLLYASKDYELIYIRRSVSEVEGTILDNTKQIYYFDDFLGSNYLTALTNNSDTEVVEFIKRIKKNKNKRFILTSRTNILQQGISLSDTFFNYKVQNNELTIKADNISKLEKAKILYNHIYFGNLSNKYKNLIICNEFYLSIVNHRNYNPRLIEFITDSDNAENIKAKNYRSFILESLDNPSTIWKNTFEKQSDEFIRILVYLVVFNGGRISEKNLEDSYYQYIDTKGLSNIDNLSISFESKLTLTEKYFLNRNIDQNCEIFYTLFNPSITDFILPHIRYNLSKIESFIFTLKTESSLNLLISLEKKINKDDLLGLLEKIIESEISNENYTEYLMMAMYHYYSLGKIFPKNTDKFLVEYSRDSISLKQTEFLSLLYGYMKEFHFNLKKIDIFNKVNELSGIYEINTFIKILNLSNYTENEVGEHKEIFFDAITEEINSEIETFDFSDPIYVEEYYFSDNPEELIREANESEIEDTVEHICLSLLAQLEKSNLITWPSLDLVKDLDLSSIVDDISDPSYVDTMVDIAQPNKKKDEVEEIRNLFIET